MPPCFRMGPLCNLGIEQNSVLLKAVVSASVADTSRRVELGAARPHSRSPLKPTGAGRAVGTGRGSLRSNGTLRQ